tara:strand:- start:445 stop:645 length:201 start_codon:yes stop_codon:yes gene_type:complete
MNILNLKTMNQNYIELAKQKLQNHKSKGNSSNLSIFQVAELLDVITGKKDLNFIPNTMMFNQIGLN